MESLVFCIVHHSASELHTLILDKCILSIKTYHKNNKIIVCHTSTSIIPKNMLEYDNVTYVNTPLDGSHVYGAIHMLLSYDGIDNYILMHDGMILLKPLPDNILNKKFYFLWHFEICGHDYQNIIINLINNNNLSGENKDNLINKYKTGFPSLWKGLFGPAFGGNIESLKKLWDTLDISKNNLCNYIGRDHIMMAERYISLVSNQLGIIDTFLDSYSLNGRIESHPHVFQRIADINNIDSLINQNQNYNSYMFKIWLGRT